MCHALALRLLRLEVGVGRISYAAISYFILVINRYDCVIGPDAPGDRVALSVVGVELFQESEKSALRLDLRRGKVSRSCHVIER